MMPAVDPYSRGTFPFLSVFTTSFSYSLGHICLDRLFQQVLGRAKYSALARSDRIYLAEKVCSSVNAVFVSGLAFRSIFIRRSYDADIMHSYPRDAHDAFVHLCGYTLYDLITMWKQGDHHYSMWIHHIMSAYGTALILHLKNPSFYPLLFCVTEITALFNNLVWYLQKVSPSSSLIPAALLLRAVMFTVSRVWLGPFAITQIFVNAEWDIRKLVHQWFFDPKLSAIGAVLTLINSFTLCWLNLGWTIAVWKLAIRNLRHRRQGGNQ